MPVPCRLSSCLSSRLWGSPGSRKATQSGAKMFLRGLRHRSNNGAHRLAVGRDVKRVQLANRPSINAHEHRHRSCITTAPGLQSSCRCSCASCAVVRHGEETTGHSTARFSQHGLADTALPVLVIGRFPCAMGSTNNFRVKFSSRLCYGRIRPLYHARREPCAGFGC